MSVGGLLYRATASGPRPSGKSSCGSERSEKTWGKESGMKDVATSCALLKSTVRLR